MISTRSSINSLRVGLMKPPVWVVTFRIAPHPKVAILKVSIIIICENETMVLGWINGMLYLKISRGHYLFISLFVANSKF